ncbi:uncharacterized protein A4U43_C04F24680 [Asparagus officinalis]|uniref:Uncharacterized protein n=1 Tax=Asparagus officinalis TaxID=4686 RepID=A0A5P1F837_ASPOF|nr:uncharacterized protein A4U43_C04F24680 [Asparagus officinalis]
MAPHCAISRGICATKGPHQPRSEDAPSQLEMTIVCYSKDFIDHHNYYGHDGTRDSEMTHFAKEHLSEIVETHPSQQPSKKQCLVLSEPEPIPGGSSRIRRESPTILTLEPRAKPSGKDPILIDQGNPDDKENVDYGANTDTYFTKSDDVGFEGNIG